MEAGSDVPTCSKCTEAARWRAAASAQLRETAEEAARWQAAAERAWAKLRELGLDPEDSDDIDGATLEDSRPLTALQRSVERVEPRLVCEGDGRMPRRAVHVWGGDAHGAAHDRSDNPWKGSWNSVNIVAVALVPGAPRGCAPALLATATAKLRLLDLAARPPADGAPALVTAQQSMSAPVLCIAFRPGVRCCAAVTAMDGSVALAECHMRFARDAHGNEYMSEAGIRVLQRLTPHEKYVSRVAWSDCGRVCVCVSADGRAAIHACVDGAAGPELVTLQTLVSSEAPQAVVWGPHRTFAVAHRSAPSLTYVTVCVEGEGAPDDSGKQLVEIVVPHTVMPLLQPACERARVRGCLRVASVPLSEDEARVHTHTCVAAALVEGRALEDRASTERKDTLLRVGFTVVDLATSHSPYDGQLIAAAADNGIIYVQKWQSNVLLARLVGHIVADPLTACTRLLWPTRASDYIYATSDRDFHIVVYSTATARQMGRLGVRPRSVGGGFGMYTSHEDAASRDADVGHTGVIKALDAAFNDDGSIQRLVSCGFDKRVIVWEP